MAKSGLSCTNCRQRKIRCNRSLPICERCESLELECSYPARQRRVHGTRGVPSNLNETSNDQNTLSAILERLRRVEERASGATSDQSSPTTSTTSPGSALLGAAHPHDVPGSSICTRCARSAPRPSSNHNGGRNPASSSVRGSLAEAEDDDAAPLDVTSVLSFSINQVQQLVKRQTAGTRALTTEGISIPPASAKRWINNYYLHMDGKLLPALVDRKLIDMMPDLITMEHVHLDACILLIYYCILWQGCFFLKPSSSTCRGPDRRYARQIFICCLRTIPIWKEESSGSVTDFIAAMYMTQTAVENFDFDLSWEMHRMACEYAHALRMHSLDGGGRGALAGAPAMSDDDRMGLWDLIHLDLFYRLINNKPAAFPAALDDWRVNMPWLSVECSQAQDEAVPTMAFLARARLTLVLMRFFQVAETTTSEADALGVIMPLCEEVESIVDEWKMEEWLRSYSGDDLNSWILGNLALSAYTCILFMLRKASLPGSNEHRPLLSDTDDMIPRTAISMRTSRRVLGAVHLMIQVVRLPGPESISLFLGNYRAYVAHAHLASGLLQDPSAPTAAADFRLLTQLAECVETVTNEGVEFMPLARSLKRVNREVERRMIEEGGGHASHVTTSSLP